MLTSKCSIISGLLIALSQRALSQASLYQPCPLLGPFFPTVTIDPSSVALKSALSDFTRYVDNYVQKANGSFGPITPNITSFSMAVFAGDSYVESNGDPFFYDYHHGAGRVSPDAESVFAIGDVTQIFTVLTLLAEQDIGVWEKSIVEFVPEVLEIASKVSNPDSIRTVDWKTVTLGALSGHMAGLARDSNVCRTDRPCDRAQFLSRFAALPPVYMPDTTPIFSAAAFQLLAIAVESSTGKSFAEALQTRILSKLNMSSTAFIASNTTLFGSAGQNLSHPGEPAATSLVSSINDLSLLGRAILQSSIISPAATRRWLKPFTSTSNLRNAVGRPWEIYHYSNKATDAVLDIYTRQGTFGRYSSYFGLIPDYDVGFAIFAVNSQGDAPDLNAYGDMMLSALVQVQNMGKKAAMAGLAGTYSSGNSTTLTLSISAQDPGIAISRLLVNGTNWRAQIATQSGFDEALLDFRLYPTNLLSSTSSGQKTQAFKGVIQDKGALVDGGTPTCVSWMTVGEPQRGIWALDEFVFVLGAKGEAVAVIYPALGVRFEKVA